MRSIWRYTAEHWGMDQADRYTDNISDACRALACGTKRGRPVEVRPGYQKYLTGAHTVYYCDRGDRLEIIRVLHNRMDVNHHL